MSVFRSKGLIQISVNKTSSSDMKSSKVATLSGLAHITRSALFRKGDFLRPSTGVFSGESRIKMSGSLDSFIDPRDFMPLPEISLGSTV